MGHNKLLKWNRNRYILLLCLLLFPLTLHASFIESTIGTAVVNDATASFYNPAALTLVKGPQLIFLGSAASLNNKFTGEATQKPTGYTQQGSSSSQTRYFLPSFYLGTPVGCNVTLGLAVLSNIFNKDIDDHSILRYAQSSNNIQSIDVVPAVGFKLNDMISFGANVSVSRVNFVLRPITGIPSLNVPDGQSRNQSDGTGLGGDVGLLLKPSQSTLIGFNYHSAVTYKLSGKSMFEGNNTVLVSNQYAFTFWTPASSVISINHFFTPKLGLIATIRRIQWHIFNTIKIRGIATSIGNHPTILNTTVPYYLHDTWLLTLGGHYRLSPDWIIRMAGTYNQSADNGNYQISNGDSIVLGASVSHDFNKYVTIDGSYAHVFTQNQTIHISNNRNNIDGVNQSFRDGISLKLTFNFI